MKQSPGLQHKQAGDSGDLCLVLPSSGLLGVGKCNFKEKKKEKEKKERGKERRREEGRAGRRPTKSKNRSQKNQKLETHWCSPYKS